MSEHRRVPVGPLIAALGAILLLVSLFLDWYSRDGDFDGDLSAWTAFEVLDLVLAGLALAALMVLVRELGARLPGADGLRARLLLPLGALALLIVVSQLINHPPAGIGRDPDVGIWLALAGSALMLAGALLAAARVSLAVDVERREGAEAPERAPGTVPTPPEPGGGATLASSSEAPTVAQPHEPGPRP